MIKHCMEASGCSINRALHKRKSGPAQHAPVSAQRQPSDTESVAREGSLSWRGFWPGVVISLALAFTFATGPFRAPDEPHHFFRAYEISEGRLIAARPGGGFLGDWLPRSLDRTAKILGGYPDVPAVRTERVAMAKAWKIRLKSHRAFIPFPGAALHSPLVYAPAALGISLGRVWHARPLILFYLARCCNAIVAGGLIGLTLGRLWRRAPYLVTIALFPMCLFQVGTLTSDALTFGISFFWFSEVLRARGEPISNPPRIRWILIAAALSQLRFPYPLLGLVVFAIPSNSIGPTRAARLRFFSIYFAALLLPCLLWISVVQGLRVPLRPFVEIDPVGQLHFIVSHPLHFFILIGSSLREFGYEFWRQTIGVFGWLNLPAPTWILLGVTLSLVVTVCSSDSRQLHLTAILRLVFLGLAAASLILTAVVVYLAWNRVGASRIEGWQGRYAIPILPLLATALANEWLRRARWLGYCALGFSIVANVGSIIYLAHATWS